MTKKVTFIENESQITKLITCRDNWNSNNTIIVTNSKLSQILHAGGISHRNFQDYAQTSNFEADSFNALERLSEINVDGLSIKEHLTIEDLSLWDFIAPSLYSGYFYYPVRTLLEYVDVLKRILEIEKPDELVFEDTGSLASQIISSLDDPNLKVTKYKNYKGKIKFTVTQKLKQSLIYPLLFRSVLRKTIWFLLKMIDKPLNKKNAITFIQADQLRDVYDPVRKAVNRGDPYYENIFRKLKSDNVAFVGFNTDVSLLGIKIMVERVMQKNRTFFYSPFENYIRISDILESISICRRYSRLFSSSPCNKNNYEVFGDINSIYRILHPILHFYASRYLLNILISYKASKNMIKCELPSIIITPESASETRCIPLNAKKVGIPTLGIQHGNIGKYDPVFNTNDPSLFPDRIVVSGEYYQEMLLANSKLTEDRIVVAGIPRYDIFAEINTIYWRKDFFEEFGIEGNKKLVLWTTDCHALSDEENRQNCIVVFDAIRSCENVTLIIKQHPAEGKKYTTLLGKYILEFGVNARVVPKDSDIYELLFVCDLLITTKDSTTGAEAIALHKPVVVLDLGEKPRYNAYIEFGVAVGIYGSDALGKNIIELLESDAKLAKNRDLYIRKFLYAIDGNATERTIKLIKMLQRKVETMENR